MYKKQLKAQKVICLLAIIASALVFIYSLGIMTDLYDSLYSTMRNPADHTQTDVTGSIIYYDMQGFNKQLTVAGIVLILLACLLFITNTSTRRRYYVANYVSTALNVIAEIGVTIWAHIQIQAYRAQFLQINFEELQAHVDLWGGTYSESTFWFDIHYAVFGIVLIAAALLVANVIWKNSLMKEEKNLLNAGKEVAA